MWKPTSLDLKNLHFTDQVIHCEVYNHKGEFAYYLSTIYTHNQITKRKVLWYAIEEHSKNIKGPWIIIGDFNNVLKINDRIRGKEVHNKECVDLESMMQTIGLTEHDTRGSPYTWSNKHTTGVIYSRIGRAICNIVRFLKYPDSDLEILNPHISDHPPWELLCRMMKILRELNLDLNSSIVKGKIMILMRMLEAIGISMWQGDQCVLSGRNYSDCRAHWGDWTRRCISEAKVYKIAEPTYT